MGYRKLRKALSESVARLGWVDGCLHAVSTGLQRATRGFVRLHKYYFVAQPVASKPWLAGTRGAAIEVREVTASDPLLRAIPRPQWVIPYRFDQGAVCLAAIIGGQCVGFLWMLVGPYLEDEVRCRYIPLPKGEAAWDFDVYVSPEHRGGLVFLRLWDEANQYLAARGVRWSLSRISAFNAGSMSSHTRMGARRVGSALFLSIGSLQISAANVRPRLFVSRDPRTIPDFLLQAS